jgi:hypothetical protein
MNKCAQPSTEMVTAKTDSIQNELTEAQYSSRVAIFTILDQCPGERLRRIEERCRRIEDRLRRIEE